MNLTDYLRQEWRPSLGCTEPACIALAAATAAAQADGPVRSVRLVADARMYKNCFAVGIPNSGRKTGIRWALALGAVLPDAGAGLEIFRQTTPEHMLAAADLLRTDAVTADVDPSRRDLYVDCTVTREGGRGRAVIREEHTRIARVERNGKACPLPAPDAAGADAGCVRAQLAEMALDDLARVASSATIEDGELLRRGADLNMAIARHGLDLLPAGLAGSRAEPCQAVAGRLVCGGVYARMSGEDFTVMSLAGSGNKGITCSVPMRVQAEALGTPPDRLAEATALACLITSAASARLGTLSAVCGCSNAAGIGLAAGLVWLEERSVEPVSLAITNMVGNIAGMVCDGAKIGCALKTMTAVDSAYRAAALALNGVGIPETDGIVGPDGSASLANLGRIANQGMAVMDTEILTILRRKMDRPAEI